MLRRQHQSDQGIEQYRQAGLMVSRTFASQTVLATLPLPADAGSGGPDGTRTRNFRRDRAVL